MALYASVCVCSEVCSPPPSLRCLDGPHVHSQSSVTITGQRQQRLRAITEIAGDDLECLPQHRENNFLTKRWALGSAGPWQPAGQTAPLLLHLALEVMDTERECCVHTEKSWGETIEGLKIKWQNLDFREKAPGMRAQQPWSLARVTDFLYCAVPIFVCSFYTPAHTLLLVSACLHTSKQGGYVASFTVELTLARMWMNV